MYPVGVVFGMGFDTATEVALLATTALLASQHLPFYAIMCLPILFTAGMSLMDTIDGIFMNFAYSWAFFNPVRKVYYNLAITGLSVAICFFIGTIEVLGLLPMELGGLHGGFWNFMADFDINKAGLRDRRHVRRLLGRGTRVLEVRPRRGKVEREAQTRASRRHHSRTRVVGAAAARQALVQRPDPTRKPRIGNPPGMLARPLAPDPSWPASA